MAYEPKPNSGTLFESKPGAKTDYNGSLNVGGSDYTVFGRKKKINTRDGRKFDIIELSAIPKQDRPQTSVPTNQPVGDLPF